MSDKWSKKFYAGYFPRYDDKAESCPNGTKEEVERLEKEIEIHRSTNKILSNLLNERIKEVNSLQSKLTKLEAIAREGWNKYYVSTPWAENRNLADSNFAEIEQIMGGEK